MIESQNALDNARPSFEREMAAYEAHVAKQQPAAPSNPTGDPRYAQEQAAFAAYQKSQPAARNEQPAAPVAASTRDADIATLRNSMAHINPSTGKPYAADTRVQAALERGLAEVLDGKPLDRAGLKAQLETLLGFKSTAAANPEPVEPQGTPEQRLTAEQEAAITSILPHIDENGGISGRHLTPELTAGYVLPDNVMFYAEETIAMCAQARKAGFTQADVDRYIQANT